MTRTRPHATPFRMLFTVLAVLVATLAAVHLTTPATQATAERGPRTTPARVAVGFDHGCAVTPSGAVECWGDNTFGELGVPLTVTASAVPVAADLPVDWRAVSVGVGEHHTCALLADGRVGCWGWDGAGQLGTAGGDDTPGPELAALPRPAVALSVGPTGSCAIVDDGGVWCWGFQVNGELGQSTNTLHESPQLVPMPWGEAAVDVSTNVTHTCAVLARGAITCWGSNASGQFGDGTTAPSATTGSASTPILLAAGVQAVDVEVGSDFTCARSDAGVVYCWGRNSDGRLGDGTTTDRSTPDPLSPAPSRPAVHLTAGDQHACVVLDDGTMGCWGDNARGQVGDGTTDRRLSPRTVAPGTPALSIATGFSTTCAMLTDGTLTCWGRNDHGQVGDGTTTDRTAPVASRSFDTGTRLAAVAPGGSHTCVLNTAGLVWCWGLNTSGQLGRGSITTRERELGEPVALPGQERAKALVSGYDHVCALLVDGNVACWGSNGAGQLGDGTTIARPTASGVSLPGFIRAQAITAGGRHTCALLADGTITCWGDNNAGQLGDGTTTDRTTPPAPITLPVAGVRAVSVEAGLEHTCALLTTGEMTCWGGNGDGQLGDGTTNQRLSPVTVSVAPGTRAMALDAGRHHTCALLAGGAVTCWGYNQWGQLGNGTQGGGTSLLAPTGTVSLPGGHPSAVALAVGDSHSCVLLGNGTASCWGYNGVGAIGDGTVTSTRSTPVAVSAQPGGKAIRALSAGFSHTCAVLDDGTLSCWGQNFNSQLGIADTVDRNAPALAQLPHEPTGLTATTTSAAVVLSWSEATSPFQPQTWTVEASSDGTTWWSATVSATSPNGTTVSGLATDVAYRFRVTSTTPLRTSTVTLAATVTLTSPAAATPPVLPPLIPTETDQPERTPAGPPTAAQIAALPLRTLVDPALLRAGATVALSVDGFAAAEPVMVVVASTPQMLDLVTTDGSGTMQADVRIPSDLGPGEHTLAVWAPDSGTGFRQLFGAPDPTPTVPPTDESPVEPPVTPPATPAASPDDVLPSTGLELQHLTLAALMLALTGLVLWRRSMHRRRVTCAPR